MLLKSTASTAVEEEEDEPKKRSKRSPSPREKRKDYLLVSALSGKIVNNKDSCLVDSGASKHITGYK